MPKPVRIASTMNRREHSALVRGFRLGRSVAARERTQQQQLADAHAAMIDELNRLRSDILEARGQLALSELGYDKPKPVAHHDRTLH
jgi:hypothetical protein